MATPHALPVFNRGVQQDLAANPHTDKYTAIDINALLFFDGFVQNEERKKPYGLQDYLFRFAKMFSLKVNENILNTHRPAFVTPPLQNDAYFKLLDPNRPWIYKPVFLINKNSNIKETTLLPGVYVPLFHTAFQNSLPLKGPAEPLGSAAPKKKMGVTTAPAKPPSAKNGKC